MTPTQEHALSLLQRYATEPIAWQSLESPFRHWFEEDGFVGYVDTGGAWVTAGPPVGPPEKVSTMAQHFVDAARTAGRRAVFFGAEKSMAPVLGGKSLCIGLRPHWDPRTWSLEGPRQASLRYQLSRARKSGVSVRQASGEEVADPASPLRRQIVRLAADWQDRHALAPMGFIVSLELFVFPEHHIYLIAERHGELVGLLSAVPVFQLSGWFVEDLIRLEHAPNGTNELLVNTFFEMARDRDSAYVTLGLEPLAGPIGTPLKIVRRLLKPFFHFPGLEHFKEKLHPTGREPRYLLSTRGTGRVRALLDVLTAFSRMGMLQFGLVSLSRGPLVALRGLALLLVTWLALMAIAPTSPWFPTPAIHYAWCLFDLVLAGGLLYLCRRYHNRLALVLAATVGLDATITLYEALSFNWSRIHSPIEGIVVLAACLGPIFGDAILWAAWIRHRRRQARFIRSPSR